MVWRDAGDSLAAHAAGPRFQEVFADSQKWLRQPRGMFHRAPLDEAEITETLIASHREIAKLRPFVIAEMKTCGAFPYEESRHSEGLLDADCAGPAPSAGTDG